MIILTKNNLSRGGYDLSLFSLGGLIYKWEDRSVTFNHTETVSTESITVYVDLDKKTNVGQRFSD